MVRKIVRLKTEPVPEKPNRKQEYDAYLHSSVWQEKREKALTRDGHRCRLCNSSNRLNVHHRCYPKILGTEPLEDLITLCMKCHEKFHNINQVEHVKTRKSSWQRKKDQRQRKRDKRLKSKEDRKIQADARREYYKNRDVDLSKHIMYY